MLIDSNFTSVSDLRRWLRRKADEAGSPEDFNDWLQRYFDDGNTVSVLGREYDYWACWELF